MTFLRHDVALPLTKHVNFLYAADGSMPYARDRIFPTPSIDLKFNFGEPWRVHERLESSVVSVYTDAWCLGIWNQRHLVEWPATTEFLGVSFKPGGAYAFLGVPLSELHNRVVPLDAIWGRAAVQIRERLYDAATPERRFALLENFLLTRLCERPHGAQVVNHVVGRIAGRHGAARIGELRDALIGQGLQDALDARDGSLCWGWLGSALGTWSPFLGRLLFGLGDRDRSQGCTASASGREADTCQ
jgi:hypothetical protein